MKTRDLAIVAAVLVIAGFAAADALRSSGVGGQHGPATTRGEDGERATTNRENDAEQFSAIAAPGSLVFTDDRDCRLREVSVGTGREFPLPFIQTGCELWAPRRGDGIAYRSPNPSSAREATPFQFLDLNHTRRELGGGLALFGLIAWSVDGQRAAWCDGRRSGFDYELGREAVRLDHCPRAYSPGGDPAYTDGWRILVGDEIVFTSRRHIDHFLWSQDGSLVVLVDRNRLERWDGERRTAAVDLPDTVRGVPVLAPDGDFVVFTEPGNVVHVFDVERERDWTVPGHAAAWSPNGEWLAVAEEEAITFYDTPGTAGEVRWTVAARALAWH